MRIDRSKLRAFFARFGRASARLPKADGNVYEFYVFLQVCEAMRRAGLQVALAPPTGQYRVRASPGAINSAFGHARLQTQAGNTFELHNGIEIPGHSLMAHEADIVLIPASTGGGTPQPVLIVECKLYSSSARLKGEVRKAVGTVVDWSQSAHKSKTTRRPQGCLHCGTLFASFFVTNVLAGRRPDIEQFLATYDVLPAFGVTPHANGVGRFVRAIQAVGQAL